MSVGSTILRALPSLLYGAGKSLGLVLSCIGLGMILGIPIGIGHMFGSRWIRVLLWGFDWVFRGFPAIVLLFIFFFGIGSISGVHLSPFLAAILALGFRSAAYQGQIYRGSLAMIDRGQNDAARALGMSKWQAVFFVLLPQALRFSIPSVANEYAVVLKDSALAFTVGVVELMNRGKFLAMTTRETLWVYITVAAIYWVLTQGGFVVTEVLSNLTSIPGFGRKDGEDR
jgi:polar amino acid transport system permease protein